MMDSVCMHSRSQSLQDTAHPVRFFHQICASGECLKEGKVGQGNNYPTEEIFEQCCRPGIY